ncbi:MlaD family protein [Lewinella sp. W8]|uniref:MlaD family protein n=1 Tax=Lewinella sp. W8 TaxID=2528208 RepID=UPI001067EF0D|nr:MlaD family protein [Lewinella sp. W8]MTB53089.1 MCE family protein [Lewinella sp. W8]
MRYEVKIGILAIVAIALSFWGYKYIEGSNLLSRSHIYYANYDNVAGLTIGTPVQISGVTVGAVNDIQLDQQSRLVKVSMDVNRSVNVPKGTVASLATISLLGEKAIELEYENPCFGNGDCAEPGSLLIGNSKSILASFTGGDDGENPLDGLKAEIGSTLDSLEYMLFSKESDNPIARSSQDLAATMENLKFSTARLQRIMDANAGEINATMENLEALTGTLASKQESIAGIIDNAEELTGSLSEVDLDKTMAEVNASITQLRGTLQEADQALSGVSGIMSDVQSGKGTLGKLLQDDAIYDRLNRASMAADTLLTDLQERPYRYIPFKSRKRVLKFDRKDAELEEEQQQ